MPLRQLFPDANVSPDTAKVDIIAVHGLNPRSKNASEHAWDTWRPPSGLNGRLWLRDDLPQQTPEARIFLYEYNATVVYGKDRDTFVGKASELLEALRIEREDAESRPLIFLGHSMGGLLIKQALINAHNNPKYTHLKNATTGLAFFGTPHNGGDWKLVSLGSLAAKIATSAGYQNGDDVMEVLKSGGIFLDMMQEHWRHQLLEYDLVSFWGAEDSAVPRESARLGMPGNRENVVKLDADHGGLSKFGASSRDQDNLKLVRGNIRDLYKNALKSKSSESQDSRQAAQIHHYIPLSRNTRFTGRVQILKRLQQELFSEREVRTLALFGLGGVGKTQVALQLAYWVKENQPEYSVLWISAVSESSFEQTYTILARRLGLASEQNENVKDTVRQHLELEANGKWFLIIDNADDMGSLYGSHHTDRGISQYIPRSGNCVLLFTTRTMDVALAGGDSNVVELGEMSPDEAAGFLGKLLIRKQLLQNQVTVKELLGELTYLPLAIAQAAAYLNRNQLSVERYIELLRGSEQDMVALMSREFQDNTRYQGSRNAVATTWLVSFEQIRKTDPTAAGILAFISLIEARAIPRSLFLRGEDVEHAIGTLNSYAFLVRREKEDSYDMHRLVHMAIKLWIQRRGNAEQLMKNAMVLMYVVLSCNELSNHELWRSYIPHAWRLLHVCRNLQVQTRFDLLVKVGKYLIRDRRFKEAIEAYEQVNEWLKTHLPEDHPERLALEYFLGGIYPFVGRHKDAIAMWEHVLDSKRTLDEENESRVMSEYELATAYLNNRQPEEAIPRLERVIEIWKRNGTNRENIRGLDLVIKAEFHLVNAHCQIERREKAIEELENMSILNEKDPIGALEISISGPYLKTRQSKEALQRLERIVGVLARTRHEEDKERLASESRLGSTYMLNGQINKAITMLRHVVEVRKRTLTEEDEERLGSESRLGNAYIVNEQYNEAVTLLRHIAEVHERTLREDDEARLSSQFHLATGYLYDDRIKEAITILKHVVDVSMRTLHEYHPSRLERECLLAFAYLTDSKVQEARPLIVHLMGKKSNILQNGDPRHTYLFALFSRADED